MTTAAVTAARQALEAHLAAGTTAELAAIVALGIGRPAGTAALRRARAEAADELIRRFPEVRTALDAWEVDFDTRLTFPEALIAALPADALR